MHHHPPNQERAINLSILMKQITTGFEGVVDYFDDVVICGRSQQEHDTNLQKFIIRAREVNLTLNLSKCQKKLTFFGHVFEDGVMKPDPIPRHKKELERLVGMLVYNSKWVPDFAETARPLFEAKERPVFPLNTYCVRAILALKNIIAKSFLAIPEDETPLTLETDAFSTLIGAVLSQSG